MANEIRKIKRGKNGTPQYILPEGGTVGQLLVKTSNGENWGDVSTYLSNYYDKDDVDTLLAGKQHTLTAGSNITIVDNVISATGGGTTITNIICTNAENTPAGVTWTDGSVTVTGTLAASEDTINNRYFVIASKTTTKNIYKEYLTINFGSEYIWEELGTVDLDLDLTYVIDASSGLFWETPTTPAQYNALKTAVTNKKNILWYNGTEYIIITYYIYDAEEETICIGYFLGNKNFVDFQSNQIPVRTITNYIESPLDGSVGQVLKKTASGTEWANEQENFVATFTITFNQSQTGLEITDCDKKLSEIYAANQAGKHCIGKGTLLGGTIQAPLTSCSTTAATFNCVVSADSSDNPDWINGHKFIEMLIYNNSGEDEYAFKFDTLSPVASESNANHLLKIDTSGNVVDSGMVAPTNTGETGQVLKKTASGTEWANEQENFVATFTIDLNQSQTAFEITNCNKTFSDITAAYNAGKHCIALAIYGTTGSYQVPLTLLTNDILCFSIVQRIDGFPLSWANGHVYMELVVNSSNQHFLVYRSLSPIESTTNIDHLLKVDSGGNVADSGKTVNDFIPAATSLPTASASLAGKIYQYLGATDTQTGLTHGYFYDCSLLGSNYVWNETAVQKEKENFIVHVTLAMNQSYTGYDVTSCDKSFTDIVAAYNAGRHCIALLSETTLGFNAQVPLTTINSYSVRFMGILRINAELPQTLEWMNGISYAAFGIDVEDSVEVKHYRQYRLNPNPTASNVNHLLMLDSAGNVADSGKTVSDFISSSIDGSVGQLMKKTQSGQEWTSIKTINNQNLLGSGNINCGDDVFVAYYSPNPSDCTPFADIYAAFQANKSCMLVKMGYGETFLLYGYGMTRDSGDSNYIEHLYFINSVYSELGSYFGLFEVNSLNEWNYSTCPIAYFPTEGTVGQVLKRSQNRVIWGDVAYSDISGKPSINNVQLTGNKTSSDLNLYSKPANGISSSDLDASVQASLALANSALQSHQSLKTINSQSLIGSGNIDTNQLFIAIYDEDDSSRRTPVADITAALTSGKACVLRYINTLSFLDIYLNYICKKFYAIPDPFRTYEEYVFSGAYNHGSLNYTTVSVTTEGVWTIQTEKIKEVPSGGSNGQLLKNTGSGQTWTALKTINNQSLIGGGNISVSDIFIATYNTTSYADTLAAYNAGKTLFAKMTTTLSSAASTDIILPLETVMRAEIGGNTTISFIFSCVSGLTIKSCGLLSTGWSSSEQVIMPKPSGGTNGQVLKKNSEVGVGVEWSDAASEIFVALYDTTTYAELVSALNAGKVIFVHMDNYLLPLQYYNSEDKCFGFTGMASDYTSKIVFVDCREDDGWDYSSTSCATEDDLTSKITMPSNGSNGYVLKKNNGASGGVSWEEENTTHKDSLITSSVLSNCGAELSGGMTIPRSSWLITWEENESNSHNPRYLDMAYSGDDSMQNINEYSGRLVQKNIDYGTFYFDHTLLEAKQVDGVYLRDGVTTINVYSNAAMTNVIGEIVQANHPPVSMKKGWSRGGDYKYGDVITVYDTSDCQFIPFANHSAVKTILYANPFNRTDPGEGNRPMVLCFGSPYGAYISGLSTTLAQSGCYNYFVYSISGLVVKKEFLFTLDFIKEV